MMPELSASLNGLLTIAGIIAGVVMILFAVAGFISGNMSGA